jgi:hypothetical protein
MVDPGELVIGGEPLHIFSGQGKIDDDDMIGDENFVQRERIAVFHLAHDNITAQGPAHNCG